MTLQPRVDPAAFVAVGQIYALVAAVYPRSLFLHTLGMRMRGLEPPRGF